MNTYETRTFENLDQVWIERKSGTSPTADGTFELHVVRETSDRAVYEDTVDHLRKSEREVVGLIVTLAGYLVHEVADEVPMMLLDPSKRSMRTASPASSSISPSNRRS